MGARPVEVPVDGAFDLDPGAMLERVETRTRWVCVPNPNNPTSRYLDGDVLWSFLDALPAGCAVLLDEAYRELMCAEDYPDGVELARRCREAGGATPVVLRTFSKAYGLAGLRVGYGVMPPELARELHKVRPSFNVNRPGQVLARAALREEEFVRRTRRRLAGERRRLVSALRSRGWEVVQPSANFFLLEVSGSRSGEDLCEALLRRGVIVRSMTPYGLENHVRVSVGTSEENDRFLGALDELDVP